ncbi:MAG: hypothetical protein FWG92_04150, partial [Leptospirales bacterium]|nr:hypothetical protein [Leptospirales bacterium]
MKFFSFIISAVFLLSPASLFTEPPTGYEIVYQKQAAKNKEERIRDVQVMPGIIILNGGALFI